MFLFGEIKGQLHLIIFLEEYVSINLIYILVCYRLCMQLYEGEYQIAREALDEFFKGWVFVQDVSWYIPSEAERQKAPWCMAQNSYLSMKKYLQIVELYAVNVLVKGLKNEELALKWLEKLNILEESRQVYCLDSVEVFCSDI